MADVALKMKVRKPKTTAQIAALTGKSEEELEKRRAEWKPLPPRVTTGYLAKYASMVGTASHGARVVAKL